ncbi:copper chaperone PCu(A)C [Demequina flava]|uniref:copper chaperone PCu(A)C n=1 Tax=Demequina flava TaxID=1095025 RepID=UPI000783008F|nr:copper chaperone PCu(A)C [Demequina flava]
MFTVPTRTRLGALAAVSVLALTACATDDSTEAGDDAAAAATEISIVDAWTKTADEGMTASFGEITNDGDDAITLVAAATDVSDVVELHETSADDEGSMSMSQKEGGFTIEPGETLVLEPGGNHIMLMDVTEPIEAGAEVTVELEFASGDTVQMDTVAKDFSGANEEYVEDHGDHDHDSMEGDSMDHDSMEDDSMDHSEDDHDGHDH